MKIFIRLPFHTLAAVLVMLSTSGCSDSEPTTNISYNTTVLTRDEDGQISEGRKQSSEAVFKDDLQESSMEILVGEKEKVGITIQPGVGKTARATLNYKEHSKELQMEEGQIKNIFFEDSDIGVRIHVKDVKP